MLADSKREVVDGQLDFSGGMNMISPVLKDNEYRYSENFSIRNGVLQTRGGIRRAFPILSWWWNEQFYFNEDNAKYNDGSHTGFWFGDFVRLRYGIRERVPPKGKRPDQNNSGIYHQYG